MRKLCAVCGDKISFYGEVKLSSKISVCRNCARRTMPFFDYDEKTIEDFKANLKLCENGAILFNAIFRQNNKIVSLCDGKILFDPEHYLICVCGKRGNIFNRKNLYNIYKLADVDCYEPVSKLKQRLDGSSDFTDCLLISFREESGLPPIMFPSDIADTRELIALFDEAFKTKNRDLMKVSSDIALTQPDKKYCSKVK